MLVGKRREDRVKLPGLGSRKLLPNGLPQSIKILLAAAAAVV